MEIVKQYLLSVYEDGSILTEEVLEKKEIVDTEVEIIAVVTRSWDQYNLISYSKRSELYEEIQNIKGDHVDIEFLGRMFKGTIDRNIARIYGLKDLMNFSRIEGKKFKEEQKVSLVFDKVKKVLRINQI